MSDETVLQSERRPSKSFCYQLKVEILRKVLHVVRCLEKVTLRKFSMSIALPMIISLHLGQTRGFNPDLMMVK